MLNGGSLPQQIAASSMQWRNALAAGGTELRVGYSLTSQLLVQAVAQPLLHDTLAPQEIPQGQAMAYPQGYCSHARQNCMDSQQEPCVDVALMGSLLQEDALIDDAGDPPGWVQDWMRELMEDGC
jgi:hypothetical protein